MTPTNDPKKPLDIAADLLVFAPVGLAIELGKQLPGLVKAGREHLEGPLNTAKFVGNLAANQGRQQFGEKLRQATEPYFGSTSSTSTTAPPQQPAPAPASTSQEPDLPIAGYETLSASQILTHLEGLTAEELEQVKAHEIANRSRKTVLGKIEQLQQDL